jgi:hypothetical protein
MRKNEVWFEVYTASGTTIDGAQETIPVEDVNAAFLERIQERQADSEDAAVLILQVDPEGETDADDVLMEFTAAAIDADVEVFALNGGMDKIELSEEGVEPEPEPEPEPVPVTAKKAAAKKAAPAKEATKKAAAPTKAAGASKRAAAPAVEEQDGAPVDPDEVETGSLAYTSEDLTKMNPPELGAVARGQGIDPKGMGKKELIAAILSVQSGESTMAASVAKLASTNGDDDVIVIIVPRSKIASLLS